MTAAAQNAILRHYQFAALGVLSVQVTPATRPLLKLAGDPRGPGAFLRRGPRDAQRLWPAHRRGPGCRCLRLSLPPPPSLIMKDIPIARQDILLKSRSFVRENVIRVQATNGTRELLQLAGVSSPEMHAFYEVPVKRDSFGRLHVDRAAEQIRDASGCLVPALPPADAPAGELANLAAVHETAPEVLSGEVRQFEVELWVHEIGYHKTFQVAATSRWEALTKAAALAQADAVPMNLPAIYQTREIVSAPLPPRQPQPLTSVVRSQLGEPIATVEYADSIEQERAYRVEVRIDETWLSTLIVHAHGEAEACDKALQLAKAREPDLDIEVWSVTLDDEVTEEFPVAPLGVGPGSESGSVENAGPGGAADSAGPGSSARSTPAFAAGSGYWGPIPPDPFSPRGEREAKRDNLFFPIPKFAEKIAEGFSLEKLVEAANSDHTLRYAAVQELAKRAGAPRFGLHRAFASSPTYKLKLTVDRFVVIHFTGFEDRRLPSPNEIPELHESPLSDLNVREVITRLHLTENLSVLKLTP